MNANNTQVASGEHLVSGMTGSGIRGVVAQVCRMVEAKPGTRGGAKFLRAECYGRNFADHAAFDAYCLLHGFTKLYGRNTCRFVSSRAFRKHTGQRFAATAEYFDVKRMNRGRPTAR